MYTILVDGCVSWICLNGRVVQSCCLMEGHIPVRDVCYLAVAPGADAAGAKSVQSARFQVLTLALRGRPTVCDVPLIGCQI